MASKDSNKDPASIDSFKDPTSKDSIKDLASTDSIKDPASKDSNKDAASKDSNKDSKASAAEKRKRFATMSKISTNVFKEILKYIADKAHIPSTLAYEILGNIKPDLTDRQKETLKTLLTDGYKKCDTDLLFKILRTILHSEKTDCVRSQDELGVLVINDIEHMNSIRNHIFQRTKEEISKDEDKNILQEILHVVKHIDEFLNRKQQNSFCMKIERLSKGKMSEKEKNEFVKAGLKVEELKYFRNISLAAKIIGLKKEKSYKISEYIQEICHDINDEYQEAIKEDHALRIGDVQKKNCIVNAIEIILKRVLVKFINYWNLATEESKRMAYVDVLLFPEEILEELSSEQNGLGLKLNLEMNTTGSITDNSNICALSVEFSDKEDNETTENAMFDIRLTSSIEVFDTIEMMNRKRYSRLSFVATDVFTDILRNVATETQIHPTEAYEIIEKLKIHLTYNKEEKETLLTDGYRKCGFVLLCKILQESLHPGKPCQGHAAYRSNISVRGDVERLMLIRNHVFHRANAQISEEEDSDIQKEILEVVKRLDVFFNRKEGKAYSQKIVALLEMKMCKLLEERYSNEGIKIEELKYRMYSKCETNGVFIRLYRGKQINEYLSEVLHGDGRPKTLNITAKIVGMEQTTAKEIVKYLNETCRQMNGKFRQSDIVLSNESSDETERLFCRAVNIAFKKFFTDFKYRTHLKLSTERRLIVDVLLFPASNSEETVTSEHCTALKLNVELNTTGITEDSDVFDATLMFKKSDDEQSISICLHIPVKVFDLQEMMNRKRYARMSFIAIDKFTDILKNIADKTHVEPTAVYSILTHSKVHLTPEEKETSETLKTDGYRKCGHDLLIKILRKILPPTKQGCRLTPHTSDISVSDDVERIGLIRDRIFQRINPEISEEEEKEILKEVLEVVRRMDVTFKKDKKSSYNRMIIRLSGRIMSKVLEDNYVMAGLKVEELQCKTSQHGNNVIIRLYCGSQFSGMESNNINVTGKIVGLEEAKAKEITQYINENCHEMNKPFLKGEKEAYIAQLSYVTREDLQFQAIKTFISQFFNTFTYRSYLPLSTDNPTNIDVLLYPASTYTDDQNDDSFKLNLGLNMAEIIVDRNVLEATLKFVEINMYFIGSYEAYFVDDQNDDSFKLNLELNMAEIIVDRNVLEATLKFVEINETSNRMNICLRLPIIAMDTSKRLNRKRYARMSYIAIELFTNILEHAAQMEVPSEIQSIRLIRNHVFQRTEAEIAELEEKELFLQILKVVERLDNSFQNSQENSYKEKIVLLSQTYLNQDLEIEFVKKGLEINALHCKMITKTTNVNIRLYCGKQFYAYVKQADFESMSLNLTAKIVGIENSGTEEIVKYLKSTCSEIDGAFLKGKKEGRIVLAVKQHVNGMEDLVLTASKMLLKRLLIAFRSHLQCATVKTTCVDVLVFPESTITDDSHGSNNDGELKLNLRLFTSRITEENEVCTATVNFIKKKTSSPKDYHETDIHLKLPINTKAIESSASCSFTIRKEVLRFKPLSVNIQDCVMIGKLIVLVDNLNGRLIIKNIADDSTRFQRLSVFPWGITKIENYTVGISYPSEKCIKIIDLEKGTTCQIIKVSAPCYGISSVDGMMFAICDNYIKKISLDKTVNCDLNSHSIFCDLPALEVYYLTVSTEKLLFSADDSVYCYDINGVFQWIYKMKIPKNITTDEDGNVFVADAGSNVIVRCDGKRAENLLTKSDGLNFPTGVHYDKQGKCLLVCNFSNGRAFLFDRN
ncbi:uncharacterized protein LOC127720692 isoform X2 [Mytilus californianus]|uniref:uncharacterized protein LOC127720692 isoform X2 n=1 Tax=Mytilus californianus TaxID=6549 RepID=UPI002246CBA8|nr:uncharacterized protein LOC127720692 isoform X2 [Mytilus californianus]